MYDVKFVKRLEDGSEMIINADVGPKGTRVLRSLGYKTVEEFNKDTTEGVREVRKQSSKVAKVVETWDPTLTVKENYSKLEAAGVKINIYYLYALVKKNQLAFKKVKGATEVKPDVDQGPVAEGDSKVVEQ